MSCCNECSHFYFLGIDLYNWRHENVMLNHKQATCECFWRNIYRIFHCGIYTRRVAGFHALVQHITASAVNPYKETAVSVGKMCHFSSFIFSLLLTTLPHRLLASVELKRYREQLCKKRNFQTTQVKLFTLTLPVSLISFPQHSEVQSQPPCVNSAGAPAPADNSTKDFHQSESLMALFEGDIKRKKKKHSSKYAKIWKSGTY